MKRHRTHEIDELAQRVLRDALPPKWLLNEQHKDYGKDYLVETGEDSGFLTGSNFFVQLKGQERVKTTADNNGIRFSLETKYAEYYLDKITDLPVFLVVVDVAAKKGWWLFLQQVLDADQSWRNRASVTVKVPTENDIVDTVRLRKAVEDAKKWVRIHHPLSIEEAISAHKKKIKSTDSRFDVSVSLENERPIFNLHPKVEVRLKVSFRGERHAIEQKVSQLLDRGDVVAFQPGEVTIAGSKLFERTEKEGVVMQISRTLVGSVTLLCKDDQGNEIGRLSDIPGHFRGGMKEFWFEGGFADSPVTVKVGPLALGVGGSVKLSVNLRQWNGRRLLQLPYFDRLFEFFRALPASTTTTFAFQVEGNAAFSITVPLQSLPFAEWLSSLLKMCSFDRLAARRRA